MWEIVKEKIVSRKFLVLLAAIAAGIAGLVPFDKVIEVALVWLGSQAAVDVVKEFKKSDNEAK